MVRLIVNVTIVPEREIDAVLGISTKDFFLSLLRGVFLVGRKLRVIWSITHLSIFESRGLMINAWIIWVRLELVCVVLPHFQKSLLLNFLYILVQVSIHSVILRFLVLIIVALSLRRLFSIWQSFRLLADIEGCECESRFILQSLSLWLCLRRICCFSILRSRNLWEHR